METKACGGCGKTKDIAEFTRDSTRKDGLYPTCRVCKKIVADKSRAKHRESNKERHFIWRQNNKSKIKYRSARYYQKNKEEQKRRMRRWELRNIEHRREYKNNYEKNKRRNNPEYNIFLNLKSRFHAVVFMKSGVRRNQKIETLIGCSVGQLRAHIESMFSVEMNWENYGSYWHLDHIVPCAAFDLTNEGEQMKCFHWTNLQPLMWRANVSKGDMLPNGKRARHLRNGALTKQ